MYRLIDGGGDTTGFQVNFEEMRVTKAKYMGTNIIHW
jgi:hypothetical protein